MKKVIIFLMFVPVISSGQIISDFESGNMIGWEEGTGSHWIADTTRSISGNFSLHHIFDNTSSGSDCIGIPITNLQPAEGSVRWSFTIRHGYDPSSSNSWAAYLMSDTGPDTFANGSAINGYAAGVNLLGYDDTLRLWKIIKGVASVIITCPVNWQSDIGTNQAANIVVERRAGGNWTISVYDEKTDLKGTASRQENTLFLASWFVLNYRYTSTRDRLLWFDDLEIEGIFRDDKNPPEITECLVSGTNITDIKFSEEPSDGIFILSNFMLNGGSNPAINVEKKSTTMLRIKFRDEFVNKKPNNLIISHLCDKRGNCADNVATNFTPAWAEPGDIIISEIMADPLPVVSLPPKEYLEIFNRTNFKFCLDRWSIRADEQVSFLPSFDINPGEYIILCSQSDTASFAEYGETVGVKSFPALTDGGRLLILCDSFGNLIHGVDYSREWYGDALKTGGGWSLEIIDLSYPFYAKGNWEASSSKKGGTPGKINSAIRSNPDLFFKGVLNVFPVNEKAINMNFSEPVISMSDNESRIVIDGNTINSITPDEPLMRNFIVRLSTPLTTGEIYTITMPGELTDFAGNSMQRSTFRFGISQPAAKGDILFNELLFNPYPDETDYLELFNSSGKIIDASQLYLASVNIRTGDTSDVTPVSAEGRCILPDSYFAITTDCFKVLERYQSSDPDALFAAASLPSMPDDKGHLLLLNREMELIDEMIYSEEMHFALLAENQGISLEKVRPDLKSDESINWHSASESSGWGTPGRQNSIFSDEPESGDRISLSSGRISPDNDGFEDVLVIDINPEGLGNVISVTVFGETGNYIRKVSENLFAGSRASVVWDGTSADGSPVRSGIYIVLIELYNDKGKTRSWKKLCAVVY